VEFPKCSLRISQWSRGCSTGKFSENISEIKLWKFPEEPEPNEETIIIN